MKYKKLIMLILMIGGVSNAAEIDRVDSYEQSLVYNPVLKTNETLTKISGVFLHSGIRYDSKLQKVVARMYSNNVPQNCIDRIKALRTVQVFYPKAYVKVSAGNEFTTYGGDGFTNLGYSGTVICSTVLQ